MSLSDEVPEGEVYDLLASAGFILSVDEAPTDEPTQTTIFWTHSDRGFNWSTPIPRNGMLPRSVLLDLQQKIARHGLGS
jgi:hypothetical protein